MMSFFLKPRAFIGIAIIVLVYIALYIFDGSIIYGHVALVVYSISLFYEIIQLSRASNKLNGHRTVADQLSLSDEQSIQYQITNGSSQFLLFTIIDELPFQLQHRSFIFSPALNPGETFTREYVIRPVTRGLYEFGKLHLYFSTSILNLIEKRISIDLEKSVAVYPSFIQMKKYEVQVFNKVATLSGIKRVRKIGKTDEFEHIKNYTQGDNIKSINWKASSRRNNIMINQFQDTRSQSVYCIIDKSRSMKMPFDQLSLLDYAINSTLVLSNVILKKYDRSGLITFNDELSTFLKADNRARQLSLISKELYNLSTGYKESNFQSLYYHIRKKISRRSVLVLFSNFEHVYDMRRALPYLRQINKQHLLVIIFFTNTALQSESNRLVENTADIYSNTFAKKALLEKEKIAEELTLQGIQVILSTPAELSVNVINKYLEIKAKRMH